MSFWVLLQVSINIAFALGFFVLWSKFRRPPKDDPRLSRGLQLLQSKISVLEDLSDKTDQQVKQIIALLEKKCRELQSKVQEADQEIERVEHSIQKSLEVSKIFEDRIPHKEIIERQKTRSYVKAAQLAHEGLASHEIAAQVDLPMGEIEMIAKVNKDRLMFAREKLPDWAKDENSPLNKVDFQMADEQITESVPDQSYSAIVKPLIESPKSLERIGEEFRRACEQAEEESRETAVESPAERVMQQLGKTATQTLKQFSEEAKEKVSETIHERKKIGEKVAGGKIVEKVSQKINSLSETVVSKASEMIDSSSNQKVMPEEPPAEELVEVVGRGGTKKAVARAKVEASAVKRIEFPRIG